MLVSVLKPAVSARRAHSMSPGPVAPGTALGSPIPISMQSTSTSDGPGLARPLLAETTSVDRVHRNTGRATFTPQERERLAEARVARLATVRPDGRPHVVPVMFATADVGVLVTAVDHKPKRSTDLQRLRNVEAHPEVSLLVDHEDDDWDALWWVRVDATARVVRDEPERSGLVVPLVAKYEAYADRPPAGPVLAMVVDSVSSWNLGE
jgi:PPOX class probable F420-dependent enzyme